MPDFIATDEQWEKMKKHIRSDKYKREDFFVFETLATGDKIIPNRYMQFKPDFLMTMRDDAEKGVALMLNHNWGRSGIQSIPVGKVFDGRLSGSSQDGESMTLYTTQYILRDDSKVDGYSKNDIIKLIETGTITDTSVGCGTSTEQYKCNICGNSIYNYADCRHVPGYSYIVDESSKEVKQCIVEVYAPLKKHVGNNVLMENSLVFDGAYPNAIIQSVVGNKDSNECGLYEINGKQHLSKHGVIISYASGYNINLFCDNKTKKGGTELMENEQENIDDIKDDVADVETETEETVETVEVEETVETEVEETETEETEEVEEVVEEEQEEVLDASVDTEEKFTRADIIKMFGDICEEVDGLVSLAKEGFEARKEVIQTALESGVHSMGNAFNKEVFEKTFSNMKIADIQEMAKAWENQADSKFSKNKISKLENVQDDVDIRNGIDMKQFKTGLY